MENEFIFNFVATGWVFHDKNKKEEKEQRKIKQLEGNKGLE